MALTIKDKISAEPSKGRVIVIGGMTCWVGGCKETDRVGGRVYKKDGRGNKVTTANLGGIVLTVRDQCPIYCADGKPVEERHWGLRERILFYSYTTVAGWPLLLALVAGEAAIQV
ncbi:hypothetical protein KY285_004577 [Solanum tuberosum]|nr:hypothetical protein KY285_004577 [Solanum tuberosum]